MAKPYVVLIPNATSPRNVGDAAMLQALVHLIKQAIPNVEIIVHSSEFELYPSTLAKKRDHTLYYWAIFEHKNLFIRLYRLSLLILGMIEIWLSLPLVLPHRLKSLMQDYKKANLIVFVGGGYIRSQKGMSQSLNLIMQLTLFFLASLLKTKTVAAPISFGPFGYSWQEKLAALILKPIDCLAVREKYSYQLLRKYRSSRLIRSSDQALLLAQNKTHQKHTAFKIGFTIRQWLPKHAQRQLEKSYQTAITQVAKKNDLIIQPIIQVDSPKFGDIDKHITLRIAKNLRSNGVKVLQTQTIQNVEHAQRLYGSIDLLLGMRMHSNILAATQETPFVAISYEYKTEGIASDLGLLDYCMPCHKVNSTNLYALLQKAVTRRTEMKKVLLQNINRIKQKENLRWRIILSDYSKSI